MPGGLMNLTSKGSECIYLTGNPTKSFFKSSYAKYTNFGLQKFRLDFTGQRTLELNKPSIFNFKVPRHGDLLMDTYLVMTLPHIWSSILPPKSCPATENSFTIDNIWRPYEFKWIKSIGSNMIKQIRFLIGGQVIQEFTGDYLQMMIERDFDNSKKDLFNRMSGNTADLNDPANAFGRKNTYPNVWPNDSDDYKKLGPEPSIRGKKIFVPLNIWFTLAATMALPLISLQYSEMNIEITMRPIKELFVIKDINKTLPSHIKNAPPVLGDYIQPNFNNSLHQFYRFLQPPPYSTGISMTDIESVDFYPIKKNNWNSDIHLISTYAFLSGDELRIFAARPQSYLVKQIYQTIHHNVVNSQKVKIDTNGCLSNLMWYLQRSDVNLRNEWSNYTNWAYDKLPYNVYDPHDDKVALSIDHITPQKNLNALEGDGEDITSGLLVSCDTAMCDVTPAYNPPPECSTNYVDADPSFNDIYKTNYKITGNYSVGNQKEIMSQWGLIVDGKYRENLFDSGVFNYIEKYTRTYGGAREGIYCYNFGLSTKPNCFQPTGAMNLSKFRIIEFEFNTYTPPVDPVAKSLAICDSDGNFIGVNKTHFDIYLYTYNLIVVEERYNILVFQSGNASLANTR